MAGMQRRAFIKAAATATVLAAGGSLALGCSSTETTASSSVADTNASLADSNDVSFDTSVDVLIVGSGAAGLAAAMDPSEAGLSVLVAEKNSLLGGESFSSMGVLRVLGTQIQKAAGHDESADDVWNKRKSALADQGVTDTATLSLQEAISRCAAEWVDRAITRYGSQIMDPSDYLSTGVEENILIPSAGLGDLTNVLAPIRDKLAEQGVTYRLGVAAENFILDSTGAVIGLRLFAPDTSTHIDVKARAVVLAAGGFCCNQKLMTDNLPGQAPIGCCTYLSDGAVLQLSERLKAGTADLSQEAHLVSDIPQVGAWGCFGPTVAVDMRGRRFAREDEQFALADGCRGHGLGFWWSIFDNQLSQGTVANSLAKTFQKTAIADRLVGPFNSLEDLAGAMDIDSSTLAKTMESYESGVKSGNDAQGRTRFLKTLSAPYYAIKQYPVRFRTLGGLKTDASARVLDGNDIVITNLYACGSNAAGRSTGIVDNAAYGLVAGKAIVDALK